jgi:chromosomal replication initiator protein
MGEISMIAEIKEKWPLILETIKNEHEVSDVSFKTWLLPLEPYDTHDDVLFILLPDERMGQNYINYIDKKYTVPLKVAVAECTGLELEIQFIFPSQTKDIDRLVSSASGVSRTKPVVTKAAPSDEVFEKAGLNRKYTFDTYVVGDNNSFAHAAAVAVAESPAEIYNPLFIYGGVGLGKTHLMQAIAHFIIENNPNKKVLYVTSETFTNELIDAIRNKENAEKGNAAFRNRYRNIDVLLIDDIQFIIGKESTQEEFFHTFNSLYQDRKQIVISSDKPPKEMETLSERLRTRFEMGLPVDIQIPTYETKMAIIKRKAELSELDIPYEVQDYVATHIKSSIRELEGALTKLSAFSKLSHTDITVEFAEQTLKDLISPDAKKEITPELIIQTVADHFNVKYDDIISSKRNANIVHPRQIAMYLCRQMTTAPLQAVGKALGNRDHTTVIHGAEKIAKEVVQNESVRNTIDIIIKKINPS